MSIDIKNKKNEQCTIPVVVCSVWSNDGTYKKVEVSNFTGGKLTKASFNTMID